MITTFYPPYSMGGDAINVRRQVELLARSGHEVDVIHCVDSYRALTRVPPAEGLTHPEGVTVHGLRSGFGALSPLATQQTGRPLFKRSQIQAILDSKPFDVIHYHNVSLVGGPGVLKMGSAVKLYTAHEHWLVCPTHVLFKFNREACEKPSCFRCALAHRRPPQLWRYTGAIRRALRHVDMLIAPSDFTLRRHQAAGLDVPMTRLPLFVDEPRGAGVPPVSGAVSSAGVPPVSGAVSSAGVPPVSGAVSTAGVPPVTDRPYFLFVGRLEKLKGLQTVIPLFREFPDADFLVAGDGEFAGELKALAAGCERIRFLGRLPAERLTELYERAVAVIVPSITHETFGSVVVEAFASGAPALVRDLGALPELVAQSGGGIVFRDEPGLLSAMRQLLGEPGLRASLGESGRSAYRERWTPEAFLEGYLAIVRGIRETNGTLEAGRCTLVAGPALH